jgi:hypothetical protein
MAEVWWEVAVGAKEQREKVCVQHAIECVRDSRTCSGLGAKCDRAMAGAGASAVCVAVAAALGQELRDVEAHGQASLRPGRRRRS